MVHDLFANFYCKSEDRKPKYRCPIGLVTEGEDFLVKKGFKKAGESYYQDYEREVSETELQEWVQDDYVPEVLDVIFSGEDFERIVLEALMLEPIDDYGTYPERIVELNGVTATFSDPMSLVHFQEEESYKESPEHFSVPLYSLKIMFDVLTMMEVMSSLKKFGENLHWTLEQWEQYFSENGLTIQR